MRRLVPFHPPTVRLSVRPHENEPNAVVARRPRGSRRPHPDATFAAVRHLIEASTLSYGQIRARTGVSHATICRWARDGGWKRPPFAPRATDLMPTPRASAKLRRRTLAARLDALAERHVRELEESACVDPDKLGEALELLNMARLAARRRPRRRPGEMAPEEASRPIVQLCVGGSRQARRGAGAPEHGAARRPPPAQAPAGRDCAGGGVAPDRAALRRRRGPLARPARSGRGFFGQPRAAAQGDPAAPERPRLAARAGAGVDDGEGVIGGLREAKPTQWRMKGWVSLSLNPSCGLSHNS